MAGSIGTAVFYLIKVAQYGIRGVLFLASMQCQYLNTYDHLKVGPNIHDFVVFFSLLLFSLLFLFW